MFDRQKKLKKLSEYLSPDGKPVSPSLQHARAISFFHRMKAAGFPVEISRNEIN